MKTISSIALALAATLLCAAAVQAQDNTVKLSVSVYQPHAKNDGINGIGIPPGADASVSSATTAIFTYERLVTPNIGIELVLGFPPRIKANAEGSLSFLGDDVFSAKIVAPTVLVNYHFFEPGSTWRPYVGAGLNYTRFTSIQSSISSDVQMGDSFGLALQAGIAYAITKEFGLYASIAGAQVKSNVVSSGSTVLTTTIDFRPIIYSIGASYSF
jgi:outer membrane protein